MSLVERQLVRLNRLIGAVLEGNDFYGRKLAGVREVRSLGDFSERVPFTTKSELAEDRRVNGVYGTNLTRGVGEYCRFHQTSGTSGEPMVWLDDEAGWEWVLGNWRWVWEEAGVVAGEAAFFPFSFGPFLGFWAGFESAASLGIRVIPAGGLSSANRLRMMERLRPEVLCCTPTYGLRLVEVGRECGIETRELGVEKLIVAGEPGGSLPAVRGRLEEGWGAEVVDHHGMTELGPVTVSCGGEGGGDFLKVNHESYFLEVVDPDSGMGVDEGVVGELVLTTLGREASPLLRYRTGDLVRAVRVEGEEGVLLEGGILGRVDDMVVVRGVNLYPGAVDEVVRSVDGVGEYRVMVSVEKSLYEVLVRAECVGEVARVLEGRLRDVFSLRIPVEAVGSGTLGSFEMKAKRWVVEGGDSGRGGGE